MPQMQTTQAEEEARAKARVELFRTQAVGIVDKAANGEIFLALKSAGMDGQDQAGAPAEATKAPAAPPPAPAAPAAPLKMPGAAKTAMSEALGAALDVAAKLAEALQAAEVDEAAPVPPELLQMAMAVEDAMGAMVDPYEEAMMAAVTPALASAAQAAPAGDLTQKAAPPAPEPAAPKPPRPRLALKRLAAMGDVHKAITEGAQKLGDLIGWAKGAAGLPAPTQKGLLPAGKAELDPYTALQTTLAAVRERTWAAFDLITKDPAKAIAEIREIGRMLDNAAIMATGGTPVAAAPGVPPAPPVEAQVAAQKAFVDAAKSVVDGMKADLLATLKAEIVLPAQAAAARSLGALAKVEKSVMAPQGAPAGEIPITPATPPPADVWRTVNADIAQARQSAAGK